MPDEVVDTGPLGGLVFSYIWINEDLLSKHIAPRVYGRVEIDCGDTLVHGLIIGVSPARRQTESVCVDQQEEPVAMIEVGGAWELNISVDAVHAASVAAQIQSDDELNVRVLS